MKIQTTVTVNELVELDIQPPYYGKVGDNIFLFIQSEDLTIEVRNDTYYSLIEASPTNWHSKKIADSVAITEDEFNEALSIAQNKIPSLTKSVAA
jgi:hypothetical protein